MSDHENKLASDAEAYIKSCGGWAWRQNSGAMKIGNRYVTFAPAGTPDVIGWLPGGRFVGIECKDAKGRLTTTKTRTNKRGKTKMVEGQVEWGARLTIHGGLFIVAREYEDVVKGLDSAAAAMGVSIP